jgi:hypothetical protein
MFIDTERNLSADSTGDNVALPLSQTPIMAGRDQFIRLNLLEFSMPKSFHDINALNNTFTIRDAGGNQTVVLPPSNYNSAAKLFTSVAGFQTPVLSALTTLQGGALTLSMSIITPLTAGNNSNVLQFVVDYGAAHGYTAGTAPKIQAYVSQGKAYNILGGKRIVDDADSTSVSLTTTLGDETGADTTTKLTFTAFYTAHYHSSSHVFLRINEQNSNIGTSSLQSIKTDTQRTEMASTKVLGIVPIDTEYIRYVAQTDNVFFTDILSKSLAQMRLQITDSLGNLFPLVAPDQNRLGNRYFQAVIRVDIMQYPSSMPHSVNNPNLEEKTAPRFSSAPSSHIGKFESMGLNGPQSGYYGDGFVNVAGKRIS